MKEVWVKVVAYKRHLIDDEFEDEVGAILSGDHKGYECFVDCYDKLNSNEYDNEVVFVNSDQKIEFTITDELTF